MKFEIKYGRFGAYFYDTEQHRDVDLNEVLSIMNAVKVSLVGRGDKVRYVIKKELDKKSLDPNGEGEKDG